MCHTCPASQRCDALERAVSRHPLLRFVADLHDFNDHCRTMDLSDGTALFRQGEPASEAYLVMRGSVHCHAEYGRQRTLVEIAEYGAMIGQAAFLPGTHGTTATAHGRTCLLQIEGSWLVEKVKSDFELTAAALASAAARLRLHVGTLTDFKMKTAEQRFGTFLLSLCRVTSGATSVVLPFDKKVIADKLGMTAPTLSRTQAKLRRIGVARGANTALYEISDVGRLRQFCQAMEA